MHLRLVQKRIMCIGDSRVIKDLHHEIFCCKSFSKLSERFLSSFALVPDISHVVTDQSAIMAATLSAKILKIHCRN